MAFLIEEAHLPVVLTVGPRTDEPSANPDGAASLHREDFRRRLVIRLADIDHVSEVPAPVGDSA